MKTITIVAISLIVVFAMTPSRAETPDEVYTFATHLKKDGLFAAAAAQFLRFARENPTDTRAPEALLSASECLVEVEDISNAVTVLETISQTYPDHASQCRVKVQLGRLYYKLERFTDADRAYSDVIVTMPGCALLPDALLGKAETLISTQNYEGAYEVLTSLIDNHIESPAAPRASYNRAYCLTRLGRDEEALAAYERIVVRFPRDPIAGFAALEAARMLARRGNDERALEYYRRAKQFESKVFFVPASMEGADLLQSAGDHRGAQAWLEELLARPDLDDPRAIHIRAVQAAFNAGDFAGVRRLADSYGQQFPKTFSPQIAYIGARAAIETRDYATALAAADELEQFAAGSEWGRSGARVRGEALVGLGRAGEGVDELQRFVTIAADSTARCEVLRVIADVGFTVTRDTTRALDALVELLAVERRQYPAEILAVAAAHERSGRNEQAAALYADLVARFPLSDEAEEADARGAFLGEFTVTDYAAALGALDRHLYEMASNPSAGGMLRVVEARIEVMKDYRGALEACRRLEASARGTDLYPRLLYLKGLCHAKIARRATHDGNQNAAKDEMKEALRAWDELEKQHAASPWAAQAAFDRIVTAEAMEGILDSQAAAAVLAKYPNHAGSARLNETIGDHFRGLGGPDNLARAANYYAAALAADNSSQSLWLKSAVARAELGKHEEALKTLEHLARDDTRVGLKAAYEAGRALRQLDRCRDAIAHFDRVAARDPRGAFGANASLQAADCLYIDGAYERALERYEAAERAAPTADRRWEMSYRIGLCLRQLGRYEAALERLVGCVADDVRTAAGATRARAYQDAAGVAKILGDTRTRRVVLEAYIEEAPAGVDDALRAASRELVRVYLDDNAADAAHELARRLVREAPEGDVEPRALLAMAMYRQGRTGEAKKEADAVASALGPDAPIVREIGVEAARYHLEKQAFRDAVEAIRPFAEGCTGPGICEQARYVYVMSLFGDKQLEMGNTVAQAFFRDYPLSTYSPMLHLRMGNALALSNRKTEALLHYEEAAETAHDSTTAFTALKNLGVSYQQLKRWPDAERVWERVLERFPSSAFAAEAAMNIGQCRMEQGKYDGAIAAYEESLPLLDGESKAWAFYWMGQSYEQLGNVQAAVVEYLKVPYLAKAGGMLIVTAQLKAAECYRRIERPDAAREIYTKVLNAHGANSNWGKIAQKGLDDLAGTAQTNNPGGDD